jgi:hypothetical protein
MKNKFISVRRASSDSVPLSVNVDFIAMFEPVILWERDGEYYASGIGERKKEVECTRVLLSDGSSFHAPVSYKEFKKLVENES